MGKPKTKTKKLQKLNTQLLRNKNNPKLLKNIELKIQTLENSKKK
jgi:hypothetical protein